MHLPSVGIGGLSAAATAILGLQQTVVTVPNPANLAPAEVAVVPVVEEPVMKEADESAAAAIAMRLKEEGNSLFKCKMYVASLEKYEEALEVLMTSVGVQGWDEGWNDLASTLHFNRASSLWKLSQQEKESSPTEEALEDEYGLLVSDKLFDLQRCEQVWIACHQKLLCSPHLILFRLVGPRWLCLPDI